MKNKSNFIKYVEELAEDAKNLTEKYGKCPECNTPDDEITGCETCYKPRSVEDEPEL